jgi:hypothetical protein
MLYEETVLKKENVLNKLILVNLSQDPNQIKDMKLI